VLESPASDRLTEFLSPQRVGMRELRIALVVCSGMVRLRAVLSRTCLLNQSFVEKMKRFNPLTRRQNIGSANKSRAYRR
jgi:hypothetical protein